MSKKKGYDFVLDCSLTMAWLFEDECTPAVEHVLDRLKDSVAIVPTIWPLEVANVLLMSQRRKRITSSKASSFVDALTALPIVIDESTSAKAMHSIYTLAESYQMTIYDAAYLELALREKIPLLSLDQDLIKAAKKAGVHTTLHT